LSDEKAASANADQQHDDSGNLNPVHFLAQTDQPAVKMTPIAPIISFMDVASIAPVPTI
jgi:hypothetical protein